MIDVYLAMFDLIFRNSYAFIWVLLGGRVVHIQWCAQFRF